MTDNQNGATPMTKGKPNFKYDKEDIAAAYHADPTASCPNVTIAFPAWARLTKVGEPAPTPTKPVSQAEVKHEPVVTAQVWGQTRKR